MKNKGITLISLIVTIIIMIILASVTVNLITNGGIIQKARDAVNDYKYKMDKEQWDLAVAASKDYITGEISKKKIQEELPGWEVNESETFDEDGTLIGISLNGFEFDTVLTFDEAEEPIEPVDENLASLEKYILGKDKQGRNWMELIGDDGFIDEEDTVPDASTTVVYKADIAEGDNKKGNLEFITYISYKDELYSFKYESDEKNDIYMTSKEYGVKKAQKTTENSNVGKYVNYDNKSWIILYDDETNGLQMVSENALKYDNSSVKFGYEDTFVNNWDGKGSNNIEKAVWSYNNCINELNMACIKIVTYSDKIERIRSIGSNPINPNDDENIEYYTSDFLSSYASSYNGKLKISTEDYLEDMERLLYLGKWRAKLEGTENYARYWIAERKIGDDIIKETSEKYFGIRFMGHESEGIDTKYIVGVDSEWGIQGKSTNDYYLRPVVKLTSEVQNNGFESGTGTKEDPFILSILN